MSQPDFKILGLAFSYLNEDPPTAGLMIFQEDIHDFTGTATVRYEANESHGEPYLHHLNISVLVQTESPEDVTDEHLTTWLREKILEVELVENSVFEADDFVHHPENAKFAGVDVKINAIWGQEDWPTYRGESSDSNGE